MNAVDILLQQTQTSKGKIDKPNQAISNTGCSGFQSLLNNEQDVEVGRLLLEAVRAGGADQMTADKQSSEEVPETLQPYLLNVLQDTLDLEKEQVVTLEDMVDSEMDDLVVNMEQLQAIQAELAPEDPAEINQQFIDIFSKLEALLSQITTKQDIAKAAPKILLLLQQWTDLDKKNGATKRVEQVLTAEELEKTPEGKLVKELLKTFQKREQLATKQQYHTAAEVTSKDISKWIHKALENQPELEQVIRQPSHANSPMPMSKLEQFVIYINDNQALPADKQLLEQFQAVLKSSAFQAKPNGVNQLSIALKPHNLGEMMVRLTEIDGEMTVKIIVNSHAAKKMLETNMHQLRNMFSPQQVVIEKQELTLQQGQDLEREQKDEQLKDQDQHQQEQSDQNQSEHSNTDDDFAVQFHALLMNEKV